MSGYQRNSMVMRPRLSVIAVCVVFLVVQAWLPTKSTDKQFNSRFVPPSYDDAVAATLNKEKSKEDYYVKKTTARTNPTITDNIKANITSVLTYNWITRDDVHKSLTTKAYSRETLLSLGAEYVDINDDFTWKPNDINYLNNTEGPCWKDDQSRRGILCLPKFYLAGFSKCGTSDLWMQLKRHKRLYIDQVDALKEPHWWNQKRLELKAETRERLNLPTGVTKLTMRLFAEEMTLDANRTKLDASSAALALNKLMNSETGLSRWSRRPSPELKLAMKSFRLTSVHLIYQYTPKAKFLLILRDPVQRIYSDYLFAFWKRPYLQDKKPSQADFHASIEGVIRKFGHCLTQGHDVYYCSYGADLSNGATVVTEVTPALQKGLYVTYIYDLLKIVRRRDVLVIHFEEYVKNRVKVVDEIFEFFGIGSDPEALEKIKEAERTNSRKGHGNDIGEMWPETKTLLKQFYQPFNEELARLLDDPKWLFV